MCVQLSDSQHKEQYMKRHHTWYAFLTDVICPHSVCGHIYIFCVCQKRASSLGLIKLTHFVVFVAARFQSQIDARLLDVFLIRLCWFGA